jgi:pimeloyl-ACP methyl ester carboxylesterase
MRSGEKIVALFGAALDKNGRPRDDAPKQPTIIFFYGNGMCLADAVGEFDRFRRLGMNVIIPEYVGYGMSSGKPSENALYETADAAYDHLLTRKDIDSKKIIASGWSLGAAVAIDLAHRRPVIGLATFSAFTSVREMGREMMPWLPVSLFVKYKFDGDRKIAEVTCPVFIGHGRRDSIIPHAMSESLERAAVRGKSPKVTRVTVDSDHNDFFEAQEELAQPFARWLESLR